MGKPVQRILGIDPGSRVVGYSFLTSSKSESFILKDYRVEEMGTIRVDPKLAFWKRLQCIHTSLVQLIADFTPTACVIEQAFLGHNVKSLMRLGEARGALIAALGGVTCELYELTPAQVKKAVTGKGNASKQLVSQCAASMMGIHQEQTSFDATDALACAIAFALTQSLFKKSSLTRFR